MKTQQLIKFVQLNINSPDYGATCFGIIRRRSGVDLLAIYWPYLDNVNPAIADLWETAETLVDNDTQRLLTGKAMRHRFCRRDDWAHYLDQRAIEDTLAPPPWEGPQRNCHFYPLNAFGLSWEDFSLYRPVPKAPTAQKEKVWQPLSYRTGGSRKDTVLMPVLLPPEEFGAIAELYPAKPVATTVWDMVADALNTTPRESLEIPELVRDITTIEGGRTRFNISMPITGDDLIRDYANANQVPIGTIIYSIIKKHPYWQFSNA
jgi:hypothetical protein